MRREPVQRDLFFSALSK